MHKIDGPFATPQGEFTEGNPSTGTNATIVTAAWVNAVQRELLNAIIAAGISPSKADDTQLLQAIQFLGGSAGGQSRNLLLNAGFELQQRVLNVGNFALTNAAKYTLDRWRCHADLEGSGSGAATLSRQPFALAQTDVPGNPKYFMRWAQSVAASAGKPAFEQRVEDITRFAEGPLTFSIFAKGSAALACTMRIYQVFGTGGSPSAQVLVASQAMSVSTTWTRFSASVNLTTAGFTLVGKTLGTNNDSYLRCEIEMPQSTAGWTIEYANAQLERNGQPSAYLGRDPGQELALCQRYFERTGSLAQALDNTSPVVGAEYNYETNTGSGVINGFSRPWRVPKRKTPTVRWWHPTSGAPDTIDWGGARAVVQTLGHTELMNGRVECATAPGTIAMASGQYEADAEL